MNLFFRKIPFHTLLCKGSQVSGKPEAPEEKDDILLASVATVRESNESIISNNYDIVFPCIDAFSKRFKVKWIGYIAVEDIEGSYFNIVGLPVQRLYQELKNF